MAWTARSPLYIQNKNDGLPGIAGDERVILLFGMRRGGDTVYALDVTNRNDPQFLWKRQTATPPASRRWARPGPRRWSPR